MYTNVRHSAQTCIKRPSPKALDFKADRIRGSGSRSEWSPGTEMRAARSKSRDAPSGGSELIKYLVRLTQDAQFSFSRGPWHAKREAE